MVNRTASAGNSAQALITQLELAPHPEGGWYRETWRSAANEGERSRGTAILFLLPAGQSSHWHRVDAEELWLWQGGDPLLLRVAQGDAGPVEEIALGPDPARGERLQGLVPNGAWQAARPLEGESAAHGYCLVSCVVVPGFEFSGFELAGHGWEPAP